MKLTDTIVPYKDFGLATHWNIGNWGIEMVWINKGGWTDDEELTECSNWDGAWFAEGTVSESKTGEVTDHLMV